MLVKDARCSTGYQKSDLDVWLTERHSFIRLWATNYSNVVGNMQRKLYAG